MKNTEKLSIFAEALINNREYKNARVNGEAVGVANSRVWLSAVKALRIPAYAIRVYRHNHMGDEKIAANCDQTPLYTALNGVLNMVGVVNGAKLYSQNIAEEIIAHAMRFRVIDITPEMAHARNVMRTAKKALDENETDENQSAYDLAKAEVERLEGEPGNCKRIPDIQSETAFIKAVELLLGNAITKQTAKSAEEVVAEEEARHQARRAKTAAKKAAKKAQATANA